MSCLACEKASLLLAQVPGLEVVEFRQTVFLYNPLIVKLDDVNRHGKQVASCAVKLTSTDRSVHIYYTLMHVVVSVPLSC